MANPERGEVALTVGDRTYTLVLDFNAQCELEELLSTPEQRMTLGRAFLLAASYSMTHIRAMVWASLRRHHSDMTVTDVGNLIESAGGVEKLLETLGKLRKASQPEGEARPHKARQTKAGARITSTPAA
jgi:hypothetical protein